MHKEPFQFCSEKIDSSCLYISITRMGRKELHPRPELQELQQLHMIPAPKAVKGKVPVKARQQIGNTTADSKVSQKKAGQT